jgi:very-short-patch-repair endonuclease
MHKDVPSRSRTFAKAMRVNPTDAERRLWSILRAGRLDGLKFKRQVPLDGYILDFVCYHAKLIVEADGGQHADTQHDAVRDAHFEAQGYRTMRFWNSDILTNPDGVARMIVEAAQVAGK